MGIRPMIITLLATAMLAATACGETPPPPTQSPPPPPPPQQAAILVDGPMELSEQKPEPSTVNVSITPPLAEATTFSITVSGTAESGNDFQMLDKANLPMTKPYTVTAPAGATEATFQITATTDQTPEPAETVKIHVGSEHHPETTVLVQMMADYDYDENSPAPLDFLRQLDIGGPGESWPPFRSEVHHYAVQCNSQVEFTMEVHKEAGHAFINEETAKMGHHQVEAKPGEVVTITTLAGEPYVIHCVPNDFPVAHTNGDTKEAWQGFIAAPIGMNKRSIGERDITPFAYFAIIDQNGVPHWMRTATKHDSEEVSMAPWFIPTGSAEHPMGYPKHSAEEPTDECSDAYVVLLDQQLEESQVHHTVDPVTCTDGHGFDVTPEGNIVLMSYEPTTKDITDYGDYEEDQDMKDSIIQVITPDGEEIMRWNSFDHIPLEDCMIHWFPGDYAHINHVHYHDGRILASLRGCSTIVMIDAKSGETIWRLGRTNLTTEQYTERGMVEPMPILNDPVGEFCGQHSARMTGDSRILLFDNGVHCQADADDNQQRENEQFSRVVEYRIDEENQTATFLRHHTLNHASDKYGNAQGSIYALPDGNWLIGWGISRSDPQNAPTESITIYDPAVDRQIRSIRFTTKGHWPPVNVNAAPMPDGLFPTER